MSEIVLFARFTPADGQRDALRDALEALIQPTRAEDGCLTYRLHERTGEGSDSAFVFYERWASAEALARHDETTHIARFREMRGPLLADYDIQRFEQIA